LNSINVEISLDLLHNLLLLLISEITELFLKSHFLHKVFNYFEINSIKITHDSLSLVKKLVFSFKIAQIFIELSDLNLNFCIIVADISSDFRLFLCLFLDFKFNSFELFFCLEVLFSFFKKECSIHLSKKHRDFIFDIVTCLNVYPFLCNVSTK